MRDRKIKILGKEIPVSADYIRIENLKFLKDNPRVYACTHGEPEFDSLPEEKQQDVIFKKLKEEPSVTKLIPDVKQHGGLMEHILVRTDNWQVIEGNSRLAVYRMLHEKQEEGEWEFIPCDLVSSLTDEQQAALLSQIHIKGKTQWTPYEQANFAFVHYCDRGLNFKKIAEIFGETEQTIQARIKIIQNMKENEDGNQSHFSYYDVLVRSRKLKRALESKEDLKNFLYKNIREFGVDEKENSFTSRELRDKLPVFLDKKKILRKYIDGEITLDEAYQRAKTSNLEDKVKRATAYLGDISATEVKQLEQGSLNSFKYAVRKLGKAFDRIKKIIDPC